MWNAGAVPARMIEIITPAGFEHFFREVAEPIAAGPAAAGQRPRGALRPAVRRTGVAAEDRRAVRADHLGWLSTESNSAALVDCGFQYRSTSSWFATLTRCPR